MNRERKIAQALVNGMPKGEAARYFNVTEWQLDVSLQIELARLKKQNLKMVRLEQYLNGKGVCGNQKPR